MPQIFRETNGSPVLFLRPCQFEFLRISPAFVNGTTSLGTTSSRVTTPHPKPEPPLDTFRFSLFVLFLNSFVCDFFFALNGRRTATLHSLRSLLPAFCSDYLNLNHPSTARVMPFAGLALCRTTRTTPTGPERRRNTRPMSWRPSSPPSS